jgi:2-polyprenyl-3-methyl-5-hydroxy-6-metoxy-1,4-benzoquinol methylase
MKHHSHASNKVEYRETDNALTRKEDWADYYIGRQFEQMERWAQHPSLIDDYLKKKKGKIFELGCGGSPVLPRCVEFGWEVGGIDFNSQALDLIRNYLSQKNCETENLICDDVFSYDCSPFENKYDLLVSLGFLEHFMAPQAIMSKWKRILKHDGLVISVIPNLFSINAHIFKRYDPEFWALHMRYSPEDMDQFHKDAGLVPLTKAQYLGGYDIHMLIPWSKIQQMFGNKYLFKITKYIAYYVAGKPLYLLSKSNIRLLKSFVMGVYANQ